MGVSLRIAQLRRRASIALRRWNSPGAWERRVDSFVRVVAPERAMRRQAARQASMALSNLDTSFAGGAARLNNSDWRADDGSVDEQLLPKLPELRNRCRQLSQNDPFGESVLRARVEGVVGTGLCPKSRPNRERLLEAGVTEEEIDRFVRQADATWASWVPEADAADELDFYGIQRLVEMRRATDGDVFVKISMLSRAKYPERRFSTALEVIVADRVDTPHNLKQSRQHTRAGIHVDPKSGRKVRCWVRVQHPGDRRFGNLRDKIRWRAVRFRDPDGRRAMLHLYRKDYPGQTRGVPLFASSLPLFQLFSDSFRAESIAIKTQACFAGFIVKKDPGAFAEQFDKKRKRSSAGAPQRQIKPGSLTVLGEGEDVKFGTPTRPGGTWDAFIERMIKTLGAGCGLSYEAISRDYTKTTYTSGRMSELTTRRSFRCDQEANVKGFYDPVREWVLEEAWLDGQITAPMFRELRDAWLGCDWQPRLGYIWVDPVKDAKAVEMEFALGLNSRRRECDARGRDPDGILRDHAQDESAQQEILGRAVFGPSTGSGQQAPEAEAPEEPDDEDLEEIEEDEELVDQDADAEVHA